MTVLLMGAAIVLLIVAAVLIGSALRVASRTARRAPSGVSTDSGRPGRRQR
ncbi:hypothetical protein [Deinococcus sp. KSM4-11]|uniref:hypothetical protein n=1 Tax=Deinococcus sp. KSM4-11 TaxID=2568654 RepID=UPI001454CDAB|nr:hypothetical protein [Deinococcus sp. KSM4-11]